MGGDALPVFDDLRGSVKTAALAGAFFVVGAVLLPVLVVNGITQWAVWCLGVILLATGGGLLSQLWPRFRRRHVPFLVIEPGGFRCPGLVNPFVPWSAVERAGVSDDPIVCTDFFFAAGVALPERDGSRANVQLSRGRRQLSIRGPAPRGMALEAYAGRIASALEASRPAG